MRSRGLVWPAALLALWVWPASAEACDGRLWSGSFAEVAQQVSAARDDLEVQVSPERRRDQVALCVVGPEELPVVLFGLGAAALALGYCMDGEGAAAPVASTCRRGVMTVSLRPGVPPVADVEPVNVAVQGAIRAFRRQVAVTVGASDQDAR